MTSLKELTRMTVLGVGMCAIIPMVEPGVTAAFAQSPRFDDARQVVGRTQADLDRAASFLKGNKKERERIRNAQKHLSEVDRHMAKGKFDERYSRFSNRRHSKAFWTTTSCKARIATC